MPSLQVRDLPEVVYRKLQMRAEQEHRSLAQQAVAILEKGLGIEENRRVLRRKALNVISQDPIRVPFSCPDPVELVRKERDER